MSNEVYKKIEERLYDMFEKMKEIDFLEKDCERLQSHAEAIRQDIISTNVDLEAYMHFGIDYSSLSVQTSNSGDSYMDKELVNAITRLEKEWKYVKRKIIKKKCRIRELERNIFSLKNNIDSLKEDKRSFIELVYRDRLSVPEASYRVNMAQMTAYRERDRLLENILRWTKLA